MSQLVLEDVHLEVLYMLMNDEHNPVYYLPHFETQCLELAAHGLMKQFNPRASRPDLQLTPAGRRRFLDQYQTSCPATALRARVLETGLMKEHYEVLHKLLTCQTLPATELVNETFAFDLVNLGFALNIFPTSGTTYYAQTPEGYKAFCYRYGTDQLDEALARHLHEEVPA